MPVAAVRRAEAGELRRRFDVVDDLLWIVVRDAQGETIDQFWADTATGPCAQEYVERFPELLVQRIRQGLGERVSIEEFERRWRSCRSAAQFDVWADRMEGLCRHRQLRETALGVADDSELGVVARVRACTTRVKDGRGFSPTDRDAFIAEAEMLLKEIGGHPRAEDVRGALVTGGYLAGFDVEARCNAGIARLSALPDHAAAIARARDRTLERLRATIATAPADSATHASIAAALGDAEVTVLAFSQPPHDRHAEFSSWVRDARAKLERSRAGR